MGWRFRRSIKIAPGVRLNFGKKSASVRIGGRGFGVTKSTTGRTTVSSGIPGTGLYYQQTLGKAKRARPAKRAGSTQRAGSPRQGSPAVPARRSAARVTPARSAGLPASGAVRAPGAAGGLTGWIAGHRVAYYLSAIVVALLLPSVHPGLVLVSLGVLIAMVPVRRWARSAHAPAGSTGSTGSESVTGAPMLASHTAAGLDQPRPAAPRAVPGEPVSSSWTGIEAWGAPTRPCRVAADSLCEEALLHVFRAQGEDLPLGGGSLRGVGCLAVGSGEGVGILVDGYPIGMLEPADGADYAPILSRLAQAAQGINGSVDLWVVPQDMERSLVTVRLPDPDRIDPPASLPGAAHVVLPRRSKIQVSGEEDYLPELSGLLGTAGEVDVAATLHERASVSGRGKPYVEVRIDDRPVGRLTPTMSEHMLPIVRACAAVDLLVVCKATLQGNQLEADIVLDTTRSGDLSAEWIATHVRAPGSDGAAESHSA